MPNKIELNIKERTATYMLEIGNGYIYINNQGYMLEISEEKIEFPIITGYTTKEENLKVGNRLNIDDLEKLDTVLKIVESANNNDIGTFITKIDISNKNNYTLLLESKGKKAYLGDAKDINDRILKLKKVLEEEEGKNGEIFLNNKEKVIFREQVK